MGTVLGCIVSEAQLVAEQNRLSTLTQMINDTPGASRGTLLTVRGSVAPTNLTPQEEARMSTLSQVIADTPGANRGTVVTVRGTLKSRPGEIITAQGVVPEEEAKRLSTLSQCIADTPGATRVSVASVLSGVGAGGIKGDKLEPLDKSEEERKHSQKRASNASNTEQLRIISEMRHAEHEAKQERASNRKSALDGMNQEQAAVVAEHGTSVRQSPSVPNAEELTKRVSQRDSSSA